MKILIDYKAGNVVIEIPDYWSIYWL